MSATATLFDRQLFHEFLLNLKYEVHGKKKLLPTLYNRDCSNLTILWTTLVSAVPIFMNNRLMCKNVLNNRKYEQKTLSLAGIEFARNTIDVSTNFTTMLLCMSACNIVRRLSTGKADLTSGYVRHEFVELQLQQRLESVHLVLKDVYNAHLKRDLVLSYCSKLMKDNLEEGTVPQAEELKNKKNKLIINNIKVFLSDLQGSSKGQIPEQHTITKQHTKQHTIISAALYGYDPKSVKSQGISVRYISEHLGVNRNLSNTTINKLS